MDRISIALLEKITAQAGVGRYVVYSEEDFFECFPADAEESDGELRRALRALISEGYIDLKYSSGNMFCVAPLKKYEPQSIPAPAEPLSLAPAAPSASGGRTALLPFIAAFTGGMAGSFIISLIFALL